MDHSMSDVIIFGKSTKPSGSSYTVYTLHATGTIP